MMQPASRFLTISIRHSPVCSASSSIPRFISSSILRSSASTPPSSDSSAPFSRPGPPPLPARDQKEFEALQKKSETVDLNVSEADAHRDLRRKPKPEFEGDVNPKTGEKGGPVNDPLKWEREWTYGGRATDCEFTSVNSLGSSLMAILSCL